jgi:hypothetical protein
MIPLSILALFGAAYWCAHNDRCRLAYVLVGAALLAYLVAGAWLLSQVSSLPVAHAATVEAAATPD